MLRAIVINFAVVIIELQYASVLQDQKSIIKEVSFIPAVVMPVNMFRFYQSGKFFPDGIESFFAINITDIIAAWDTSKTIQVKRFAVQIAILENAVGIYSYLLLVHCYLFEPLPTFPAGRLSECLN